METADLSTPTRVIKFLEDYCTFGNKRLYMLFAMARPKENPSLDNNETKLFREIVTHEGKLGEKYHRLKAITETYENDGGESLDFRLYLTTNARNVNDAFGSFQKTLIDMQQDIARGDTKTQRMAKRLDEEWKTTLHNTGSKDDNYFVVDIDSTDAEKALRTRESLDNATTVKTAIETPNGYHIVTEPFDYQGWEGLDWNDEGEVNPDDLLYITML